MGLELGGLSNESERARQKWEYLVLHVGPQGHHELDRGNILGHKVPKGLFASEELHPIASHYDQLIEDLRKKTSNVSLVETLNLLGNDGWELVTGSNNYSMEGTGDIFLFFKRQGF